MEQHIVSAFDEDLQTLNQILNDLANQARAQLTGAMDILRSHDLAQAEALIAADKKLDALEIALNDKAVEIIAKRAPMARDLRQILAALKIASSLERIGDYAKNMAKRSRVILKSDSQPANETLLQMGSLLDDMLKDILTAYNKNDTGLAMATRARDIEIDELNTKLFHATIAANRAPKSDDEITGNMHFLFMGKNLERIGDFITAIAEQIYFMIEGTLPEDDRPKADETAI